MNYPGIFKGKYGDQLRGKTWLKAIDPQDAQVFVQIGHEAGQHGKIGGQARAAGAKRDGRGRFLSKSGTNKRTGSDPRAGTCEDQILWQEV